MENPAQTIRNAVDQLEVENVRLLEKIERLTNRGFEDLLEENKTLKDIMLENEDLRRERKTLIDKGYDKSVEHSKMKAQVRDIRGTKDKVIKKLKENLKKKDKIILKHKERIATNNLVFRMLMGANQDPVKKAPEKLLDSSPIWALPYPIPRNTTFAKVILPDGRKAWEARAMHVGASETMIEYYYLTPKGLDMKTDMYSTDWVGMIKDADWVGMVKDTKEI
tara:strand:- start:5385 stop:6050 length:666 start_codon:yes stop_codon:yes gene_type:complete